MLKYEKCLEEDFIIYNINLGICDFVTIGKVETNGDTTQAWLDEPYEIVGPFCVDELLHDGKIDFAACIVMSKKRYKQEKNFLYQKSSKIHAKSNFSDETKYRELLCLPLNGRLDISQIKTAFKHIVKTVHPDVGGSHEKFIEITRARDVLVQLRS
jgi:hypothetical protein